VVDAGWAAAAVTNVVFPPVDEFDGPTDLLRDLRGMNGRDETTGVSYHDHNWGNVGLVQA